MEISGILRISVAIFSASSESQDDNSPDVPYVSFFDRQTNKEHRPKSTAPSEGLSAGEPQIPGQIFLQGQIQIMSQGLHRDLLQSDWLAVQRGIGAEKDKTQHQD